MRKWEMFVNELADSSILKKQSECMHLCQSLTSVGNKYIYFFSHKKANTALLFEGELHFCFVKAYFLFKCVKAKLK